MDAIFFFQAEDGIRDLVRSRGLGDVYKRQLQGVITLVLVLLFAFFTAVQVPDADGVPVDTPAPVSYTHLTLPTIYSV